MNSWLEHLSLRASRLSRVLQMNRAERKFFLRAWAAAPVLEGMLLSRGLAKTVEWIKCRSSSTRHPPIAIERATELTRWAYRMHPLLRGKCLEQSLTQFYVHHRDGTNARLVVGIRNDPNFAAHAWIEGELWSPQDADTHGSVFATGTGKS